MKIRIGRKKKREEKRNLHMELCGKQDKLQVEERALELSQSFILATPSNDLSTLPINIKQYRLLIFLMAQKTRGELRNFTAFLAFCAL